MAVTKAFRTDAELAGAIKQLAAVAGRDEGELLGDMLDAYLIVRSPELADRFRGARRLLTATPDEAAAALADLRRELAETLPPPRPSSLLSARDRLLRAREEMRADMKDDFVTKPILDTETGKEYRTEYQAGKALHKLVGGDINDTFVWFKIQREFPDRFRTKNPDGEWVPLDDPSVPKGKLRNR